MIMFVSVSMHKAAVPFKNALFLHCSSDLDSCQVVNMFPGKVEGRKGSDVASFEVE